MVLNRDESVCVEVTKIWEAIDHNYTADPAEIPIQAQPEAHGFPNNKDACQGMAYGDTTRGGMPMSQLPSNNDGYLQSTEPTTQSQDPWTVFPVQRGPANFESPSGTTKPPTLDNQPFHPQEEPSSDSPVRGPDTTLMTETQQFGVQEPNIEMTPTQGLEPANAIEPEVDRRLETTNTGSFSPPSTQPVAILPTGPDLDVPIFHWIRQQQEKIKLRTLYRGQLYVNDEYLLFGIPSDDALLALTTKEIKTWRSILCTMRKRLGIPTSTTALAWERSFKISCEDELCQTRIQTHLDLECSAYAHSRTCNVYYGAWWLMFRDEALNLDTQHVKILKFHPLSERQTKCCRQVTQLFAREAWHSYWHKRSVGKQMSTVESEGKSGAERGGSTPVPLDSVSTL